MAIEYYEAAKWVLPASKELYKNRHEIMSSWDKIISKIFGAKTSVAFVGPGGIGKTVLLDHITGKAYEPEYKAPGQSRRQESGKAKAEENRLAIIVSPGQGGPQIDSFSKIFHEERAVDGVVFVAGNGLVTLRRDDAVRQNIASGFDTICKWKLKNIQAELEYLKEVAAHIRNSSKKSRKPKWMIVAVTKLDLLFDNLSDVEEYYSPHGTSEFSEILNNLVVALGTDNFEWDAMPVCSALDDFSWGDEVVSSQLGEKERDHYLSQMVEKLGEMCR